MIKTHFERLLISHHQPPNNTLPFDCLTMSAICVWAYKLSAVNQMYVLMVCVVCISGYWSPFVTLLLILFGFVPNSKHSQISFTSSYIFVLWLFGSADAQKITLVIRTS